jgi:hypothetical protein
MVHHPKNVVGIHDQVFFPLDLYLRTGILGQDHHVPGAHLQFVRVVDDPSTATDNLNVYVTDAE